MTPIEILAIIFAVLIIVKLLFVIFKPKTWVKITKPLLKNTILTTIIYLILAVVVGYYIFTSGLSIVQVAAVMLFTSLLMATGFLAYPQSILKLREAVVEEGPGKSWLSIIIWLAIAIWTLIVVFA